MDYATVSISVKRLEQRARKEAALQQIFRKMEALLNVEGVPLIRSNSSPRHNGSPGRFALPEWEGNT
jgi:hypothetical protein